MTQQTPNTPPGWYQAPGDPAGTQRYWDGNAWQGQPQPVAAAGGGTPGTLPGGHVLADPWSRVGARLIDALIFIVIALILVSILWDGQTFGTGYGFFIIAALFGIGYEVGFIALKGATPGKMALGLKVIREEDGVTPPGWNTGVMRWLPSLAGNIPFIGPLIGLAVLVLSLVWLFGSDGNRQTVYDKVGKTFVVKA